MVVLPPVSYATDTTGNLWLTEPGKKVKEVLKLYGVVPSEVWLTSAAVCYSNDVNSTHVEHCSYILRDHVAKLNPRIIIPIGDMAARSVALFTFKRGASYGGDLYTSYTIPSQKINTWVCPVMEPIEDRDEKVRHLFFMQQFRSALECEGRPFRVVPQLQNEVEVLSPRKAVRFIERCLKVGRGVAAIDYETNSLKPEHSRAEILTASICWNNRATVAFSWIGNVPEAFAAFLKCAKIRKIASNLQFEHRWSKAILGVTVKGWLWDTMQAAHILDNRRGTSSIKFQGYVLYGQTSYNDYIEEFFQAKEEKEKENAHAVSRLLDDVPLNDILIYNGVDSVLEYRVAMIQSNIFRHPARKLIV